MHTPKSPNSVKPVEGPQRPSTATTHTNPYQSALKSLVDDVRGLKREIETDFTHLMQKVAKYRKSMRRKDEMGFKQKDWYTGMKESIRLRAIKLKHMEQKLIILKEKSGDES
jgi:hypothetical protein